MATRRAFLLAGTVVTGVILAVGYGVFRSHQSTESMATGSKLDLLLGQDWSHFGGAQQSGNAVNVIPLGAAIVNQDGSTNQANSPVNIRGPHLTANGPFALSLRMEGIKDKVADFRIYSSVPVIYDEWRYETPSVQVEVVNGSATVSVWDGTSDNPTSKQTFHLETADTYDLILNFTKQTAKLSVNSRAVGTISTSHDYTRGSLWFGADAALGGGGWKLAALSASPSGKSKLSIVKAPSLQVEKVSQDSLRSLAQNASRHLPIGAALAENPLLTDSNYRQLAGSQFSMLTPENAMKAQFIHPQPDVYSFENADTLVSFAQANGMQVHGHALVFGEANPAWMQQTPLGQRQAVMVQHINAVVGHYKGKVQEWDVVNEPLADNDENDTASSDIRQTIWEQAMGEQYMDIAFRAARQADPNAKLYINDFGLEANGDRWDSMVALLKRLQSRGVPIDGVGFQAHVYEDGDQIDPAILAQHIETLEKMGLKSRISEMDVTGEDEQQQAIQYAGVLQACLREPSCTSFTTWGVTDKYGSTTSLHTYPLEYGDDLLWNENFQPKAAYTALQNTLKQQ